jgi:hypothetical protein
MKVSFIAAAFLAAPTAFADIGPKAAADFVLSTCLPAMTDPAYAPMIAQEQGWPLLSVVPVAKEERRAQWLTPDFKVTISQYKNGARSCWVIFNLAKVERGPFFAAIFPALELTPRGGQWGDVTVQDLRNESYVDRRRELSVGIISKAGTVVSFSLWSTIIE